MDAQTNSWQDRLSGMPGRTRQEVAQDIYNRLDRLTEILIDFSPEEWDKIVGKDTNAELARGWVTSLLEGMAEGTVTVGDPRLADMLQRIEDSALRRDSKERDKVYKDHVQASDAPEEYHPSGELDDAISQLEFMTQAAIRHGLTTAGQDLFAEQSKGRGKHDR